MNRGTLCLAAGLLIFGTAFAEPVELFLSSATALPDEPLRGWGGRAAEFHIYSNRRLSEPQAFVLSQKLTAPVQLHAANFQSREIEPGLYLNEYAFAFPKSRAQQRYLLQFEGEGLSLVMDVFPVWLREQVARKAKAYSIQIEPEHARAEQFFTDLGVDMTIRAKRPTLHLVHSEHELVFRESSAEVIWQVNCDTLDANDPGPVLRFEALLEALKTLK